jgi:demethylspheroidene O-methyltransferase
MDLITVIRVVHDHDDDSVLRLLRNIRKACNKNATLLIAEPFAGNKATAAVTDAYFNMYFAAMGQGRTRTPHEIAGLASQAGFGRLKIWPTNMPLITGVLTLLPEN